MDKVKKLLRKVRKKERDKLKKLIEQLIAGDLAGLKIKKIKSLQCYRVRAGRFRVFFQVSNKKVIILNIKLRNEETYK
ncbi:MAG: type II toxin-antitoxin system RelE/ParE family toxin [bacterium]